MENESFIWEQQVGETAVAFEAFAMYRNLEPSNRSIRDVAKTLDKSATLIGRWSSTHNWIQRCLAYDSEQDRKFRSVIASQRRRMAERQVRTSALAQSKVAEFLINLNWDDLSPTEAARWYEVAVKVERQALGEPDKLEITGADQGAIRVEQMSAEEVVQRLSEIKMQIGITLGDVNGNAE